jgi:very-short-patch-repair endonuclease
VSVDSQIARLAETQRGNVTLRQLRELGLSREAVRHRRRTGRLVKRHRGVYAWGTPPTDWLSRAHAGHLAAGFGSTLCGTACAATLGALPPPAGPIHLIRPTSRGAHPGLIIHREELPPSDRGRCHGLPVTSPARLMLDLAATEPRQVVDRVYNELQVLRLLTGRQLAERLPGWGGRRGIGVLRELVGDDLGATRSVLEDLFLPMVRRADLPVPRINELVEGWLVDAVWREQRVIVELDGRRFHDTDPRFQSDRARSNALAARGWVVLRFTYRRLKREPYACIAELAAVLSQRPALAA